MEKKRRALRKKVSNKSILKEKEDEFLNLIAEIIVNMIMEDEDSEEDLRNGVQNPLCNPNGSLEHSKGKTSSYQSDN